MFDHFVVLLSMFLWGANWTAAKLISNTIPTSLLVFYRFMLTSIVFVPIIYFLKIPFKITKSQLFLIFICSLLIGLYQFLFFYGLKTGAAAAGGVLVTTITPLFMYMLIPFFSKKSLKKGGIAGLLGTIVTSTGFFHFTEKKGAKAASAYTFTVPFFAVLVAYYILGETLSISTIIGGFLAFFGMILLRQYQDV